ncbi:MAG TPA: type II toxin-antitoxin system RelE/ParE family toxin [Candidatus Nanoarchaeia archaeon]|nr:type II toxin-antitoxin system RelE/ParE family toxin [Candidatus Nanoarchaeia archaeon]
MYDEQRNILAFINPKVKQEWEALKEGKFEDKQLYKFIDRAIDDLKANPTCGIKIPKNLWPKEYVHKYGITNLWKYNLPDAWRLIYIIETDEVRIANIILEWFDHKEYEKRFKY